MTKIAVTTQGNEIFQHFGKCPLFTFFDVENGEMKGKTQVDASGSGHSALAGFLKANGADVVICGGIGEGARNMLIGQGITLVAGQSGDIEAAVRAYLEGKLQDSGAATCGHHDHEQGHNCNCH